MSDSTSYMTSAMADTDELPPVEYETASEVRIRTLISNPLNSS